MGTDCKSALTTVEHIRAVGFLLRTTRKDSRGSGGETQDNELLKDTDMLKRLKDINDLPEQDKQAILYNLDALLRDAKTRLAYK